MTSNEISETKKQGNELLTVYYDYDNTERINEYCFGNFVDWCCNYSLMRDSDTKFEVKEDFEEFEKENKLIKLPVFAYIHGGISFSTQRTGQFADVWDSGFFGFIYATHEEIKKEYNIKNITKKVKENVLTQFEHIIEMCSQAETEGLYRYKLNKIIKCDKCHNIECVEIMSIGGFLGFDHKESGLYESVAENSKYNNWGKIKEQ